MSLQLGLKGVGEGEFELSANERADGKNGFGELTGGMTGVRVDGLII